MNASPPLPARSLLSFRLDGSHERLHVAPWTTLLDPFRHELALTGTKKGCDHRQCGACTVLFEHRRKGIGEIGLVGVSAAIANAVFHATGQRVRRLPITLDHLLHSRQDA